MGILLLALGMTFVASVTADLALRKHKFRRADEKTAKAVNKYRYRGW